MKDSVKVTKEGILLTYQGKNYNLKFNDADSVDETLEIFDNTKLINYVWWEAIDSSYDVDAEFEVLQNGEMKFQQVSIRNENFDLIKVLK
ncbi:MAG: hypothetical protein UH850_07490 [Paludibacteraceae bacterium]|nr:hypothetical protein [Paludibacteraceae bacterium]